MLVVVEAVEVLLLLQVEQLVLVEQVGQVQTILEMDFREQLILVVQVEVELVELAEEPVAQV